MEKIKLIKSQIKKSIHDQKWSVSEEKYTTSAGKYKKLTYLNCIEPIGRSIDTNNSSIRIIVIPRRTYLDDKVMISIKTEGYWREFNGTHYGFKPYEMRMLRWKLYFGAIKSSKIKEEREKQVSVNQLLYYSGAFINENRGMFRDSKIDKILDDK